jgi:hypothetical protein
LLAGLGEGTERGMYSRHYFGGTKKFIAIYIVEQAIAHTKRKSNRQFIYENPLQELRIPAGPKDEKEM